MQRHAGRSSRNETHSPSTRRSRDDKARCPHRVVDLSGARLDDPARQQRATRRQVRGERLRQLDQDGRHQVGEDERIALVGASRQRALACLESIGEAVALRVLARRRHRQWIGVDPDRAAGAEPERGQRQDAGAAADVEDAVRHRLDALQQLEAATGGRMQARPERHARIQGDGDLAGAHGLLGPGRHDHHAADPLRDVVPLPGVDPVGVVDRADAQRADRPQAERLQMPQRTLGGLDPVGGVRCLGQVGGDDVRGGRILARPPARRRDRESGESAGRPCRHRCVRGSR